MEAFAIPDVRERLHDDVDALVAELIDGFSTQALGEDIIDIHRVVDRLEAELIRRLHRFHAERGALAEGGGTTVSWLRRCGMTAKAAGFRLHLARVLGELPASLDGARSGRASFCNVAMIGHLAKDLGVEQVQPIENILMRAAETFEPHQMRRLTQETRLRLDPDGVLEDDSRVHARRWFECEQTYGNVFVLRGQLDAEGGALVKTAIDALSHGLARNDAREGSQRRADALVDMAATQLRCGDHRDVHGQRPHLTLTVSAETLRANTRGSETVHAETLRANTPGSETVNAYTPGAETLRANTPDGQTGRSATPGVDAVIARADAAPAELHGVGTIHPETARRIACDAVRTVVMVAPAPPDSVWMPTRSVVPLSVGRATRTIPAHIRTALVLRDQGCRFPGCDRPPAWTDGHHIIHWSDGGPTKLENLISLCRRHHRRVHEQGLPIRIGDGGAVVDFPP